jgi:hypothetical protein
MYMFGLLLVVTLLWTDLDHGPMMGAEARRAAQRGPKGRPHQVRQQRRLAHEQRLHAKQQQQQQQEQKHFAEVRKDTSVSEPTEIPKESSVVKGPKSDGRFLVLHDNFMALRALRTLLHIEAVQEEKQQQKAKKSAEVSRQRPVWLYDDMPRWKPKHAEKLWAFGCGETQGSVSDCHIHEYHQRQREEKQKAREEAEGRRHKQQRQRKRPVRLGRPMVVGLGLDLNLMSDEADLQRLIAMADTRIPVIALVPSNVLMSTLRDGYKSPLSPMTTTIPGRQVGVARSSYVETQDIRSTLTHDLHDHHRHLLCPENGDPKQLYRVLQQRHDSHAMFRRVLQQLQEKAGWPVLEIKIDDIRRHANETLSHILQFLDSHVNMRGDGSLPVLTLPDTPEGLEAHHAISAHLHVPRQVLLDCEETIEAVRILTAVDLGGVKGKHIIDDLDKIRQGVLYHHHRNHRGQQGPNGARTNRPQTRPGRV